MNWVQESEGTPQAPLLEGQAHLSAKPAQAHIGEPVVWTLSVEHAVGDGLPGEASAPFKESKGWALLSGPSLRTEPLGGGRMKTEVQWTYLSLRPGSRTPTDYALTLKRGAPLKVELGTLEVLGELQEGEEVPRAMAPIREIPAGPSGHGAVWLGLGVVVVLAFVLWRIVRRGGSKQLVVETPTVWNDLAQAQVVEDAAQMRQSLFDWHRDLRLGMDAKLGQERGASTDAEWLELGRATAGAQDFPWSDVQEVLEELERLKYVEPMPGRLTLQGLADRVIGLAQTLQPMELSKPPEPGPAQTAGPAVEATP